MSTPGKHPALHARNTAQAAGATTPETPEQQPQQPCAQPPHTSQPAHILSEKRYINDAAHQLRTPLAGIISQAELALQETDPQRLRQRIETIHAAAQRGAQLVRQMLALARSEAHASNTEPIDTYDLATLAREVTREWVPKSLALSKDLGYEGLQTAWVRGNRFMMREAISNLIDNALLYTPPNGIITVSVKLADAPSHPPTNHASANHTSDPADGTHDKNHSGRGSTSSSARSNDNTSHSADSGNKDNNGAHASAAVPSTPPMHLHAITLEVADNGPGVAPSQLPYVFDRFWRADDAHTSGSGLGLPLVARIASRHGGSATAHNAQPSGFVVRLHLPAVAAESPPSNADATLTS